MADMDLTPRTAPDTAGGAPRNKRKLVPVMVLILVLVAGGVIVTQFLNSAVDYFCNVDEVGVRDGCDTGRRIRLQGTVDPGSLDESVAGVTTFTMSFGGKTIGVDYDGIPGGVFKECIPVVVHGEIDGEGRLEGNQLDVKHSNEYESANDDKLARAQAQADTECPAGA